eukprot:scaffold148117_cov13-Prasinocladus_malaysianus.AAC.1
MSGMPAGWLACRGWLQGPGEGPPLRRAPQAPSMSRWRRPASSAPRPTWWIRQPAKLSRASRRFEHVLIGQIVGKIFDEWVGWRQESRWLREQVNVSHTSCNTYSS